MWSCVSSKLGFSTRGPGAWGSHVVCYLFLLLCSSGQRSWMLFMGFGGAHSPSLGLELTVPLIPQVPLMSLLLTSFPTSLPALGIYPTCLVPSSCFCNHNHHDIQLISQSHRILACSSSVTFVGVFHFDLGTSSQYSVQMYLDTMLWHCDIPRSSCCHDQCLSAFLETSVLQPVVCFVNISHFIYLLVVHPIAVSSGTVALMLTSPWPPSFRLAELGVKSPMHGKELLCFDICELYPLLQIIISVAMMMGRA